MSMGGRKRISVARSKGGIEDGCGRGGGGAGGGRGTGAAMV